MKKGVRCLGAMLLLCAPLVSMAQSLEKYGANREQLTQTSGRIEQAIKTREPRWKLKKSLELDLGVHQDWKSGSKEIKLSTYIYDSSEEASKMLLKYARMSSVAGEEVLEGFGDEAFYLSHRYFSWVLVRKDRTVAVVTGPPDLELTKRFAQHALEQMGGK